MSPNPIWQVALSDTQHTLVLYALTVTGLSLAAFVLRMYSTRDEVSARFRPAVVSAMCTGFLALIAYVWLLFSFESGYDFANGSWVPNENAILTWAPRYFEWTVTVPMLVISLIAVSSLTGGTATRVRTLGMALAAGMIFTGFIGGVAIDHGTNQAALIGWSSVSAGCMVGLYVLLVWVLVRASRDLRNSSARGTFMWTLTLLLIVWFAYPIVFSLHGTHPDASAYVAAQIGFSIADIIAKVGFGCLLFKVAKLRTAEDMVNGLAGAEHTGAVWISGMQVTAPGRTRSAGELL